MRKKIDQSEIYTIRDLMRMFGVTRQSIWSWQKKGILPPPTELGGRKYWHYSAISRLFAA